MPDIQDRCIAVMKAEGLSDLAIRTFCFHLARLLDGESGTLGRDTIAPVGRISEADATADFRETGKRALGQVALVKLNGGLGTSMGLEKAKSLLPVRGDLTFLDLVARQVLAARRSSGRGVPLFFMNSFRTEADTLEALGKYPDLAVDGLPLTFLQHKVPKVLADGHHPATCPPDPSHAWCPPGHGDIYTALETTGLLDRLLGLGIHYAFMSNADNLGAVLDASILGFMVENDIDFLMEAAERTDADRKGGHLCRMKTGRLALRESAQCPPGEETDFQDIEVHKYFNTNNIWVHLPSLKRLMLDHDGILPLSTIVNRKTLDPRDPESPAVIQLETAMGSAISLFPKSAALRVTRQRFSPVKTTNDLLGVRSDAYELTDDGRVRLNPCRDRPPVIELDPEYFGKIDDFERRFPKGVPSLQRCRSLTVQGDVTFEAGISIVGDVAIRPDTAPTRIEAGTEITTDWP